MGGRKEGKARAYAPTWAVGAARSQHICLCYNMGVRVGKGSGVVCLCYNMYMRERKEGKANICYNMGGRKGRLARANPPMPRHGQ